MLFCKPSRDTEQGDDAVTLQEEGSRHKDKNPLETAVTNIQQFFDDLQKKDNNDKSQDKEMPGIVQKNLDPKEDVVKSRDLLDMTFDTVDVSLIEDVDDDDDCTSRDLDTTFDTVDTSVVAPSTDCSSDAMHLLSGNKDVSRGMGYGQFVFRAFCLLLMVTAALAVSTPESTRELFIWRGG
jgi:hypothetical protein